MEKPFSIVFKFNLNASGKIMDLCAEVELKNSAPHYKVARINRVGQIKGPDILPEMDIKCVMVNGEFKWVHTDSGKETYLSMAIGKAIESQPGQPQVASPENAIDDDTHEGF
jgi:hypothetical protein